MKLKKNNKKIGLLATLSILASVSFIPIIVACSSEPKAHFLADDNINNNNNNNNSINQITVLEPNIAINNETKLTKNLDNKYQLNLLVTNANNKFIKVTLKSNIANTSTNNLIQSEFAQITNNAATVIFSELDESKQYSIDSVSIYKTKTDNDPYQVQLLPITKKTVIEFLKTNNSNKEIAKDHKPSQNDQHISDSTNTVDTNTSNKQKQEAPTNSKQVADQSANTNQKEINQTEIDQLSSVLLLESNNHQIKAKRADKSFVFDVNFPANDRAASAIITLSDTKEEGEEALNISTSEIKIIKDKTSVATIPNFTLKNKLDEAKRAKQSFIKLYVTKIEYLDQNYDELLVDNLNNKNLVVYIPVN